MASEELSEAVIGESGAARGEIGNTLRVGIQVSCNGIWIVSGDFVQEARLALMGSEASSRQSTLCLPPRCSLSLIHSSWSAEFF